MKLRNSLLFSAIGLTLLASSNAAPILSSNFDAHGSADEAAEFSGITWTTNGVSDPGSTITLSTDAAVQTDGSPLNLDRLAVARNIDNQGPWSIDIPFTALSGGTILEDLTFDYQFISNGGANQGGAHPDSGIVTVSILNGGDLSPISSVTLPALGTDDTASNSGMGIIADFDDVPLAGGASYVLRFLVDSNVGLGNNFALDSLSLNGSSDAPDVVITKIERLSDGSAQITWSGPPSDEYGIDYSFDLTEESWLELTDSGSIEAGSATGTFTDIQQAPLATTQRIFYRVRPPAS